MYIYIYTRKFGTCTYTHVHTDYAYTYKCIQTHIYIYTYVYVIICTYIHRYMFTCGATSHDSNSAGDRQADDLTEGRYAQLDTERDLAAPRPKFGSSPMGPCSYMEYTWALKKFRCPQFWAYVCTILVCGPIGFLEASLGALVMRALLFGGLY